MDSSSPEADDAAERLRERVQALGLTRAWTLFPQTVARAAERARLSAAPLDALVPSGGEAARRSSAGGADA